MAVMISGELIQTASPVAFARAFANCNLPESEHRCWDADRCRITAEGLANISILERIEMECPRAGPLSREAYCYEASLNRERPHGMLLVPRSSFETYIRLSSRATGAGSPVKPTKNTTA